MYKSRIQYYFEYNSQFYSVHSPRIVINTKFHRIVLHSTTQYYIVQPPISEEILSQTSARHESAIDSYRNRQLQHPDKAALIPYILVYHQCTLFQHIIHFIGFHLLSYYTFRLRFLTPTLTLLSQSHPSSNHQYLARYLQHGTFFIMIRFLAIFGFWRYRNYPPPQGAISLDISLSRMSPHP